MPTVCVIVMERKLCRGAVLFLACRVRVRAPYDATTCVCVCVYDECASCSPERIDSFDVQ